MGMSPKLHSISSLSVETGISRRVLAKRLAQLPPAEKRGRVQYWLLREVLRHIEQQDAGQVAAPRSNGSAEYDEERTRLTRAKADLAELDERERRGELVPVAAVDSFLNVVLSRVRQGILTLPARVAPKGYDAQSIPELERIVLEDCEQVLKEIAETKIRFVATDRDADQGADDARASRAAESSTATSTA